MMFNNKTALQDGSWEIAMKRFKHITALITVGLLCVTGAVAQTDKATIDKALSPLPMDLRADATVYTYDDEGSRVTLKVG